MDKVSNILCRECLKLFDAYMYCGLIPVECFIACPYCDEVGTLYGSFNYAFKAEYILVRDKYERTKNI